MKKSFRYLAGAVLLPALMATQTGCIFGVITGPAGWVSWGVAVTLSGVVLTPVLGSSTGNMLVAVGLVLDEKNPGRVDALNPMPMDESVASSLGVTMSDLDAYNDELPRVISLNQWLESRIKEVSETRQVSNADAQALGFDSAEQLMNAVRGDALSRLDVLRMADRLGMSESTLRIYLSKRFEIKLAR